MRIIKLNLFLLLLAFLPIELLAFEAFVWQNATGKINSELIIYENELATFSKNGKCFANISFLIEFRNKHHQVVFSSEKEKTLELKYNQEYLYQQMEEFDIPAGEYDVWIQWNQGNDAFKIFQNKFSVKKHNLDFFFGDLLIFSKNKKIAPASVAKGKTLEVISNFKTKSNRNIRIQSTLLYQMRESPGKLTRAYITQQQKNKINQILPGIHQQNFQFELEGLPSGKYLVDISVFEDNQLVAEKMQEFTLTWSGLDSVFSNLDSSILQMEYVTNKNFIQYLLNISNEEIKIAEFKKFWKIQNISLADHESLAMENYYKLIYQAHRKFQKGWKSDDAKKFVLYSKSNN